MIPDPPASDDTARPAGEIPVAHPVHNEDVHIERSPVRFRTTASPGQAFAEIILLVLAGAFLLLGVMLVLTFVPEQHITWAALIAQLALGLTLAGLCILFARRHGEKPASLGWTVRDLGPNVLTGAVALMVTVPLLMAVMLILSMLFPEVLADRMEGVEAMRETFPEMSLATIVVMSACIAVWEETVFRGFLLTRLQAMTGRWWISIPLGAVLFSTGHAYQGISAMIMIGVVGLVMGTLAAWRKSIVPCIVFHMLFDISQLVLLQKLFDLQQ